MTKTYMWFELKRRRLGKSGVFILLKACPTGFFHGKTASPKFQFSSPGHRTWGIFNPCSRGYNISVTLSNICYLFYYNECSYLSCCLQIICYPSDFFLIIFWFCKLLGVIINKIDSKNTKAHERQTDKQIVTRSWGWQTKMSPCKPMKMQDFHANLHRISYTVVCWFHIFKISRYKYYT